MAPPRVPATLMPPVRGFVAVCAALLGIAATFSLGMWQVRRAAERAAIDSAWEVATNGAARELHDESDFRDVAANVPVRVRLRGVFDPARVWWLDNRIVEGRAGFLVVAALRVEGSGQVVLVVRGWAPRDPAERTRLPSIRRPDGVVDIEGIAVANVPRVFEIGARGTGLIRQNLDFTDAAAEIGAPVARFALTQTSAMDDGLERHTVSPSGGGPERSRGYAFQWFALSALITVLLIVFGSRWWRTRSRLGRAA